jgi:hypothetical protein
VFHPGSSRVTGGPRRLARSVRPGAGVALGIITSVGRSLTTCTQIPSQFSGGCACRMIRYDCDGPPQRMVNCHCRDCQRAGGAGYSPSVVVSQSHFRVWCGEPRYYGTIADSGHVARRAFCGDCGCPLFAQSSARPELVVIRAGSLDDPSWFKASVDVWTESAQPWDILNPGTEKHAGGRPLTDVHQPGTKDSQDP